MNLYGKKVLILNQDYRALTICSIQKAFVLVYMNKAEMVAEYEDRPLHTVSATFATPSIIRLFRYVHLSYRGVILSRQNVFRRDGNECQYCGSTHDLTLDHVLPRSRGGLSTWENLAKKGDLTPEEAKMPLKRKPFKPSFLMFLRDFSGRIDQNWLPYLGKPQKVWT
jgi:5-methylcytosine-specific restriction endonuclease McrA